MWQHVLVYPRAGEEATGSSLVDTHVHVHARTHTSKESWTLGLKKIKGTSLSLIRSFFLIFPLPTFLYDFSMAPPSLFVPYLRVKMKYLTEYRLPWL